MTKQSHTAPEEKQTIDLLLRRYKIMDELVEKVRQENIKAGVDPAVMKYYIPWTDFVHRKIKLKMWIDAVVNPKKGTFYDVKYLRRKELIGEDDASEYENKTYPYRRLNSLHRIKDKAGNQWLMRLESWYGLSGGENENREPWPMEAQLPAAGEEFMISVNDLDFYFKPKVQYKRIPKDPEYPNGPSIRVGTIVDNHGGDPVGDKVYLTPFSIERVQEFLRYGSINEEEPGAGTTLVLLKEGGHSAQVSYEDFIAEDIEGVIKRVQRPAPTFDSFMNEFKDRLDKDKKDDKDKEQPYK